MESQETLVSIVMPVYNSETYMDEAVLSIIHQTYQNWELLVVNEFGSSEEGTRIIKRYEALDKRIRLIQNTQRLGIAESLNEGLRQAKGKYIARMDADDISLPRRLEKQVFWRKIRIFYFADCRWRYLAPAGGIGHWKPILGRSDRTSSFTHPVCILPSCFEEK